MNELSWICVISLSTKYSVWDWIKERCRRTNKTKQKQKAIKILQKKFYFLKFNLIHFHKYISTQTYMFLWSVGAHRATRRLRVFKVELSRTHWFERVKIVLVAASVLIEARLTQTTQIVCSIEIRTVRERKENNHKRSWKYFRTKIKIKTTRKNSWNTLTLKKRKSHVLQRCTLKEAIVSELL